MRPHLVAGLAAAAVALSACGGHTPSFTSDLCEDAPARVNDLSEIARFGLLSPTASR